MHATRFVVRTLLATLLGALLLPAQVAVEANERYQSAEDRARMAGFLDAPDREDRQKPKQLLESIGLNDGEAVADVGTGTGFMLPYFVAAVGPAGRVYAEDVHDDFLSKAREKIQHNQWKNVETVLGTEKDPRLPAGQVDLAFILDAYHHFNYPLELLRNIRESLKPGGRLVVVDFYRGREHPSMSEEFLKKHIRLDRDGFAAEVESAGFRLDRHFDHEPHQYVLIFKKGSS